MNGVQKLAIVSFGAVAAAGVALALATTGCGSATPAEKSVAADTRYSAEMLRCVDDASTLEESKRCRADVRAKWHVDAGTEGGAP